MAMSDALLDALPLAAARTESSDGCRIAYWIGGNRKGPAIVLLHGYALDHSVWLPALLEGGLLERFHVVAPDLRGHGASGHPSAAAGYLDGRLWADDLDAVLRSSAVSRPVVAAWSWAWIPRTRTVTPSLGDLAVYRHRLSPTATRPEMAVPVTIRPMPLMTKARSTDRRK